MPLGLVLPLGAVNTPRGVLGHWHPKKVLVPQEVLVPGGIGRPQHWGHCYVLDIHVYLSICMCLSDVNISVYLVLLDSAPRDFDNTLLQVFLSSSIGKVCKKLECVSHYVPIYDNHYYSICDSCVVQGITHHYNCFNGSHLCGPSSIGSALCGSATTVDPKGHHEKFCGSHHCTTVATTSVTDAFLGICQL